jgi:pilus assembly protein CpaB
MNRARLLMIGVLALAAGLLVALLVYKNLQPKTGVPADMAQVMVAANDLQVGARVEERDIKVIQIPSTELPPGAPRRKADVIGRGVILPIPKGDFILSNNLAGENAGAGLPALIPPGMRAVSVRVNEVISVAGFVTPGTRVDVLLTGSPNGGEQETTTVLQNVAVLASGRTLERTSTGEAQNTAVITLLVTPDDAQRLSLASKQGTIQLSLRNPLDTKQDEVPPALSKGLFHGAAAATPIVRSVVHRDPIPKAPIPVAAPGVNVEVYQGDKKQEYKFSEEGSGTN